MSNKKNKDDNALIYSGIKNYINSENFSAYQYLLESISNTGKVSQEGLDDILSNTVIKKACCKQNENEEDNNYYEKDNSYDYLLDMNLRSLTLKKLNDLKQQLNNIIDKLDALNLKSPHQLYIDDIHDFEKVYNKEYIK